MNFAFGIKLTNGTNPPLVPSTGPMNTTLPTISGLAEIGNTVSVSDGVWTGNGPLGFGYQWTRNGADIPGAIGASLLLSGADDQSYIGCKVTATDAGGSTAVMASGFTALYPLPSFSVQPGVAPGSGTDGTVFSLDTGIAGPGTLSSVVHFSLDGVNKMSELTGLTWDSSGASPGTLAFQVLATNSGGSVLSDMVTAYVQSASATAPNMIADANWTVADAQAGGSLVVRIAAMADHGGAPITGVQYQLDGAGPWVDSGLVAAGAFLVTGLNDGQNYALTVRAVNSIGPGLATNPKAAVPLAGTVPTVALTTLNRATGGVEMSGVSEPGTYFGLINYDPAIMAGTDIEAAVNGGGADAVASFGLLSGANGGAFDKTNVTVGTAYFHGVIKNAAGLYSADVPLAFVQPFVDVVMPGLVSSSPAHNAVNQPAGTNITLTFDEDIQLGTGQVILFDMDTAMAAETFDMATGIGDQGGTVTASTRNVTFDPGVDLQGGHQYSLRTISAGAIVDTSGNPFAGWTNDNTNLTFSVVAPGAGIVFVGDGASTTWAVNHILGPGSSGQTPLPASFSPGTYVIATAVAVSKDVLSLSLDGVPASLRTNVATGSERVAIFDVSIPGGGNGVIELGLSGNADDVGVAVWEVGSRSFVGAVAQSFANRKTDLPADLSIATNPGDAVITAVMHNNTGAASTWLGLTQVVASRVLTDRVFAAAHNVSASGGTPENFEWTPTINWIDVGAVLAVYR